MTSGKIHTRTSLTTRPSRGLATWFGGLLLLGSGYISAQSTALDTVVAVVDNDVIMHSELEQRSLSVGNQLRAKQTPMPPADAFRSQVLERLIIERIQLQKGDRINAMIKEEDIDSALTRIQQNSKLGQDEFYRQLEHDGLSPQAFRQQIRQEMVINELQRATVNRRIDISQQDVHNFLNSTEGKIWSSPNYQLGHILIASQGDPAAAKQKAQALQRQLNSGADFRQLAKTHSAGQGAQQGGDMGWRKVEQLPALFSEQVNKLTKGDISTPFESPAGFHLLKLYDQQGGGELLIEQTKSRHILVKTSAILNDDEAREKLLRIRNKVVGGADFAEMARKHSEDIASMLSGGDLGWSSPGMFVPEFTAAMDKTAIDQVSQPFQSQFGWHILQVQERRQQDMSEKQLHNQVRNLLRQRRFNDELQIWLQEIRDEAFVRIKGAAE